MLACGLPGWAALSAGGIERLILPAGAMMVLVAADSDLNGAGQLAAARAAARFRREGRRVRVALPPKPGTDWNDVMRGRAPARIEGPRHAAR
jgi:putative DNA primase/helicase